MARGRPAGAGPAASTSASPWSRRPRRPAQLDALYAWADAVLLPSRFEGVPLIVLEAQRFGCAVVATDVGATAEAIEDGADGFLVPHTSPSRRSRRRWRRCCCAWTPRRTCSLPWPPAPPPGSRAPARRDGMRDFLDHLDRVVPGPLR